MKVEEAFQLLPDDKSLDPLRGLIMQSSDPSERDRWGSGAPYLTVARWDLVLSRLRDRLPEMLERTSRLLETRYRAAVAILACGAERDPAGTVDGLLASARIEAEQGRYDAALDWCRIALRVAAGVKGRRLEIRALLLLGSVGRHRDRRDSEGYFLRALTLAEAEGDDVGRIEASEGAGWVALANGDLGAAHTWFRRGEALATGPDHALRRAQLLRALAEVARRRGEYAQAIEHLRSARSELMALRLDDEVARVLDALGSVEHARGEFDAALVSFRDALAWQHHAERDPRIECSIRGHLAALQQSLGRFAEAEQELRAAERIAVAYQFGRGLAQVYVRLGTLRGCQGDETGFVFFEQALAFAGRLEPAPGLDAECHLEYGRFHARFGRVEEARDRLGRARDLYARLGDGPALAEAEAELARLSA